MLRPTPLSVFIIPSTSLSSLENRPFLYHVNLSFQPLWEVSALFYCTVPIFSAHLVLWGWFWCTLGLHRWGRCGVQGTVEAGAQIPGDCDCAGCCRNLWSLQNTAKMKQIWYFFQTIQGWGMFVSTTSWQLKWKTDWRRRHADTVWGCFLDLKMSNLGKPR